MAARLFAQAKGVMEIKHSCHLFTHKYRNTDWRKPLATQPKPANFLHLFRKKETVKKNHKPKLSPEAVELTSENNGVCLFNFSACCYQQREKGYSFFGKRTLKKIGKG